MPGGETSIHYKKYAVIHSLGFSTKVSGKETSKCRIVVILNSRIVSHTNSTRFCKQILAWQTEMEIIAVQGSASPKDAFVNLLKVQKTQDQG